MLKHFIAASRAGSSAFGGLSSRAFGPASWQGSRFYSDAPASTAGLTQLWIGNLAFTSTTESVQKLFEPYGATAGYTRILCEKGSTRSKGMALVAVDEAKAQQAIADTHGKEFEGRQLKVQISTLPILRERREGPQAPSS